MSKTITITVVGIPAPGGSKRAFAHAKTGKIVVMDDAKRNTGWKQLVAYSARQQYQGGPLRGPLAVTVIFKMPRPASHWKAPGTLRSKPKMLHHMQRPDATKLWRSTEDALNGILWGDDSQIVEQMVKKAWTTEQPGAWIGVTELLPD